MHSATHFDRVHAHHLLESDALYFELGAELYAFCGGTIAFMRGFETLPAGCVVQRLKPHDIQIHPAKWIEELEDCLRDRNIQLSRLYLQQSAPLLERALHETGYVAKTEVGFLSLPSLQENTRIKLHPVISEDDWAAKLRVHHDTDVGSDGYVNPANTWTAFVRRKWETGGKHCYLIEHHGEIVGTVGTMELGTQLRIKNLYIRPAFRRANLGRAVLEQLRYLGHSSKKKAIGVFGILDSPGDSLYRRCGFRPSIQQVEWTRPLMDIRKASNEKGTLTALPAPSDSSPMASLPSYFE